MKKISVHTLNTIIYDATKMDDINNAAIRLYPQYQEYTKYDIIYFRMNKLLINKIFDVIKSRIQVDILAVKC